MIITHNIEHKQYHYRNVISHVTVEVSPHLVLPGVCCCLVDWILMVPRCGDM